MHGFLTNIVLRQLRHLALGAALSMAVVAASALGTTRFPAPKFNQAELAVEKAQYILAPSLCETPSEKHTESCMNLVRRAEELLARARQAVTAAATVASGGDVAVVRP